jgi:hypothetical protein
VSEVDLHVTGRRRKPPQTIPGLAVGDNPAREFSYEPSPAQRLLQAKPASHLELDQQQICAVPINRQGCACIPHGTSRCAQLSMWLRLQRSKPSDEHMRAAKSRQACLGTASMDESGRHMRGLLSSPAASKVRLRLLRCA